MTRGPSSHQSDGPALYRLLARNTVWNLLGTVLPLLVAIVAIPWLVHGMGAARFGILSLAWVVVGYFGLFDFGLGRALTRLIAQRLGQNRDHEVPPLVWTAMILMTGLGMVGGAIIAACSPALAGGWLAIPPELRQETLGALLALSLSVPVVISTTGFRGILEGHQRFGLVNLVRVPLGLATFLAPLAVLPFSQSLVAIVSSLVVVRILSWVVYLVLCRRLYPGLVCRQPMRSALLGELLGFGGWMTVSNVVGPALLYLGRLMIAVLVSAEAVAYFSTPYDAVTGLLIVPGVLVAVLIPAFARLFQGNAREAQALYYRSLLSVGMIMLPLCIAAYVLARPGLAWWINQDFADHGYRVARLLAIGVFMNSFGHVSQALIQSYGRPDLTAKLHVAELAAYVPYLSWLVRLDGIDGAALAWVVRVAISTLALTLIARACLGGRIGTRY